MRRLFRIAAAIASLHAAGATAAVGPPAGAERGAGGAPPPCAVGDVLVRADPVADHATLLLDTTYRLPADAAPPDLVPVREAGFDSDTLVRAVIVDDLRALYDAAAVAGVQLEVQSGYRSFEYQRQVWGSWVATLGPERAARVSARPGHSEHQLGTAVDLRAAHGPPAWEAADWATTPEGAWTVANAYRFGFVLSYPRGAEELTCYDYEPWHFRWVGRELAAAVHASGLPLRAYLHRHHPPQGTP